MCISKSGKQTGEEQHTCTSSKLEGRKFHEICIVKHTKRKELAI